jgi:hypothetical protein
MYHTKGSSAASVTSWRNEDLRHVLEWNKAILIADDEPLPDSHQPR